MSAKTDRKPVDKKVAARRWAIRGGLFLAYVLAIWACYVFGKGHTILVDNKSAADGSYQGLAGILVSIDGKEALELYKGDRDRVLVKSQSHRIKVTDLSGTVLAEKRFKVPIDEGMVLLSIPRLVAGIEPVIEKFVPLDELPPPDEGSFGASDPFVSPLAAPLEAPALPTP